VTVTSEYFHASLLGSKWTDIPAADYKTAAGIKRLSNTHINEEGGYTSFKEPTLDKSQMLSPLGGGEVSEFGFVI